MKKILSLLMGLFWVLTNTLFSQKPATTLPNTSEPAVTLKGHIGVQVKHAGAPKFFRNIKIKEI